MNKKNIVKLSALALCCLTANSTFTMSATTVPTKLQIRNDTPNSVDIYIGERKLPLGLPHTVKEMVVTDEWEDIGSPSSIAAYKNMIIEAFGATKGVELSVDSFKNHIASTLSKTHVYEQEGRKRGKDQIIIDEPIQKINPSQNTSLLIILKLRGNDLEQSEVELVAIQ